jgi:HSP20 family protein
MSLIRWDPFTGVDDLFARMPAALSRWPRGLQSSAERAIEWTPSVDISETDTEFLIRAELPAVKKEDVHVTIDDRMLTISGERRQKFEEKQEKSHRVEMVYGKFTRSFALPDNADANAIRADASEGVVTVHVAKTKAEARRPTEIKIQ